MVLKEGARPTLAFVQPGLALYCWLRSLNFNFYADPPEIINKLFQIQSRTRPLHKFRHVNGELIPISHRLFENTL